MYLDAEFHTVHIQRSNSSVSSPNKMFFEWEGIHTMLFKIYCLIDLIGRKEKVFLCVDNNARGIMYVTEMM